MDIFKITRKIKTIYHSKSSFFQIIRPLSIISIIWTRVENTISPR